MNFQTFVTVAVGMTLAFAVASTFIKLTSRQFTNNPAESAYHSAPTREAVSQKAEDTAERQRRMMDNLKAQMERNKR